MKELATCIVKIGHDFDSKTQRQVLPDIDYMEEVSEDLWLKDVLGLFFLVQNVVQSVLQVPYRLNIINLFVVLDA